MMVCPACGSEYRDGITHCADCFSELVAAEPEIAEARAAPESANVPLVSVFETGNPSLVALAKSLLESAHIEFVTRGEALQDLFGLGRLFSNFNPLPGPVVFEVKQEDAADAVGLLADLESDSKPGGGVDVVSEEENDREQE